MFSLLVDRQFIYVMFSLMHYFRVINSEITFFLIYSRTTLLFLSCEITKLSRKACVLADISGDMCHMDYTYATVAPEKRLH